MYTCKTVYMYNTQLNGQLLWLAPVLNTPILVSVL